MKKTILFLFTFVTGLVVQGQSGFNFKGLVADGSGNPLVNATINVRIAIKEGNVTRWSEQHANVNTDANGIFSVVMGAGNKIGGTAATFDDIDWNATDMKYTVAVDSGNGYQTLITDEDFQGVPFAKMADKIRGVQDAVYVGATSGRKLQVTGPATSAELVEFRVTNVSYDLDVLQLVLPSGATNGDFIEANLGGSKVFGVSHVGAVFIDGGIKMNRNIRLYNGKVKRGNINNSDFLPVAWGSVDGQGNIDGNKSSNNFTVTKIGTGHYEITINGISDYSEVVVIANGSAFNYTGNVRSFISGNTKILVRNYDTSSNQHADGSFNFVAFKR